MCLAVPAKILECTDDSALVELQGNRLRINKVLTPEADTGDWVLVHAGFAIITIEEKEALETWSYLRQAYREDIEELSGIDDDEFAQTTG